MFSSFHLKNTLDLGQVQALSFSHTMPEFPWCKACFVVPDRRGFMHKKFSRVQRSCIKQEKASRQRQNLSIVSASLKSDAP